MTRAQRQLLLYQSPPHPCGYLDEQSSSSVFIDPDAALNPMSYGALLQQGFRRSGTHVYRPQCPNCQACLSARLPVAAFQTRRRHRRALQANQDLTIRVTPPRFDPRHFALYQAYTAHRHAHGEMAQSSEAEYRDFLIADWCHSEFLEFWLDDRLVAVAVTDRIPDGISAVYTFFDPELAPRSLGIFAVLSQLSHAQRLGLPYLYLGYWIADCQKMRYKADFRPIELLVQGRWQTFDEHSDLPATPPA